MANQVQQKNAILIIVNFQRFVALAFSCLLFNCKSDPYLYEKVGFDSGTRPVVEKPNPSAPSHIAPDYYYRQPQAYSSPQGQAPQSSYQQPASIIHSNNNIKRQRLITSRHNNIDNNLIMRRKVDHVFTQILTLFQHQIIILITMLINITFRRLTSKIMSQYSKFQIDQNINCTDLI